MQTDDNVTGGTRERPSHARLNGIVKRGLLVSHFLKGLYRPRQDIVRKAIDVIHNDEGGLSRKEFVTKIVNLVKRSKSIVCPLKEGRNRSHGDLHMQGLQRRALANPREVKRSPGSCPR